MWTEQFPANATLCLFGVAAVASLKYPLAGLGICVCCLIVTTMNSDHSHS
jgi:hypothetical protein